MKRQNKISKIRSDLDSEIIADDFEEKYGSSESLKKIVRDLLTEIGEDTGRQGLIKTPERVSKAYRFLTKGYHENIDDIVNNAIFNESYDEIVIVKDIDFYSLCEHHLLPFYGKCHVGYIPKNKIIGLSKIPRIVEMFARRLQVQERLTTQIGEALEKVLEPQGVAVVTEARHLCMMMRGVEKQNSIATASCMTGVFERNDKTRSEFLRLINSRIG